MFINNFFNPETLAGALSASAPLDKTQLDALTVELTADPTGRGYSRMDDAQVVVAINSAYLIVNPVGNKPLPRKTATADEYAKIVSVAGARAGQPASPNLKAQFYLDTVIPLILRQSVVDLTSTAVTDTFVAIVALAVLTQKEVDAFMTRPDVDYQLEIEQPARGTALFGENVFIEHYDIVAARG